MADCASFNSRFENTCSYALQKFGLDHFKEKRSLAMKELILGRDAYVNVLWLFKVTVKVGSIASFKFDSESESSSPQ